MRKMFPQDWPVVYLILTDNVGRPGSLWTEPYLGRWVWVLKQAEQAMRTNPGAVFLHSLHSFCIRSCLQAPVLRSALSSLDDGL